MGSMETQQSPWKRLTESPLQSGDYYIEVFYIQPGRRHEGLWRALVSRCIVSTSPYPCDDRRTATTAENWDIMEEGVWEYLYRTYGEQLEEGLYPCPPHLAKEAVFDTPKPKRGVPSHVLYKSLKARIAELEAENRALREQIEGQ